ncbi:MULTISPECIES: hypothetical protein [unclassified Breznakia]|uniref:hypothetical protein n=1 Tax=unclassified Breznakia TaxID=2623764 RepID=UPI0024750068|nr:MULTISPECIES: hypothetical protein [unclassified Breznakia]MDH6367061.1 hypothetical protein [Breznakia sp. PH1-1]MDH6404167.1 hypothetical protein [Breznakia sp. PF1-11]MDH6411948.1 hypothetical protein [Breznakia sp. PFB1-11]MDH6414155.1 hypothetical protein [Breznakia sp. PFB1-14]MDH6418908.1 hypothetical protein [Breznakia sp. PFB1-12]
MKNLTRIKIPKKYIKYIDEVTKDSDGYWAFSKEGVIFESMGCHTAHEPSQKELLSVIRTL